MTLSVFYQMLRPYCLKPELKKKGEYVSFMISHIIEEQWEASCPVLCSEAKDHASFLRKILSGHEPLPYDSTVYILAHIDKERFSEELKTMFDEDSIESLITLGQQLKTEGYDNNGSIPEVVACCAKLYEKILKEIEAAGAKGAKESKHKAVLLDEATRAAEELRKLCDSVKPKPIDPPPEIAPEEERYIDELFAAYGSAAGVPNFGKEHLQQYGYDDDLVDRRIDYFAAETIRHGVQEVYGGKFADQFDVLKKETLSGVKNTARRSFSNGYERMLAVMEQAPRVNVESYLLCHTKYWIGNSILCGVCHHLVNDGALRWVK